MAEYVRLSLPPSPPPAPTEFVVELAVLEELLGRKLMPYERRMVELRGARLWSPCSCEPLPAGSLLEKLVCRNGHRLS